MENWAASAGVTVQFTTELEKAPHFPRGVTVSTNKNGKPRFIALRDIRTYILHACSILCKVSEALQRSLIWGLFSFASRYNSWWYRLLHRRYPSIRLIAVGRTRIICRKKIFRSESIYFLVSDTGIYILGKKKIRSPSRSRAYNLPITSSHQCSSTEL